MVRLYVKVVSKLQITPKYKAWADEKTQHTRAYVFNVRGRAPDIDRERPQRRYWVLDGVLKLLLIVRQGYLAVAPGFNEIKS